MKEVKWGLIGCGDIARKRVAPALQNTENSSLLTISRFDFSKAESFAKEFGVKKWTEKWQDLVSDEEINCVYVATPVNQHAEQTIAAAESGKNVLCEKPMAMTADECTKMIDACTANNVKLGVAYYRHMYPAVVRIKEIISNMEIGKVVHIQANNYEHYIPRKEDKDSWRFKKELAGGGPMMDMGCHRIEVFYNLMGVIKSTSAFLNNIVQDREVEDMATAHFEFENGGTALLVSSHGIQEPKDTLDIYGSLGSIHVPVLNEGTLLIKSAKGERREEHPNHKNLHQPLVEDFVRAVLENREPAVTGKTGRAINKILDIIYA